MGSLMGGWGSHESSDPNVVKYRRNESLTKEEINAFWKSKKLKEDANMRELSPLSPRSQEVLFEEVKRINDESGGSDTSLEKIIQKNGWWVSSKSAFLNEPPVIAPDGTVGRYASQFHVVGKDGTTKTHGINA